VPRCTQNRGAWTDRPVTAPVEEHLTKGVDTSTARRSPRRGEHPEDMMSHGDHERDRGPARHRPRGVLPLVRRRVRAGRPRPRARRGRRGVRDRRDLDPARRGRGCRGERRPGALRRRRRGRTAPQDRRPGHRRRAGRARRRSRRLVRRPRPRRQRPQPVLPRRRDGTWARRPGQRRRPFAIARTASTTGLEARCGPAPCLQTGGHPSTAPRRSALQHGCEQFVSGLDARRWALPRWRSCRTHGFYI